MSVNVLDLKAFYESPCGQMVRRILCQDLREVWPDLKGLSLMGVGYAQPYLRMFQETERLFALASDVVGVHAWPKDAQGLVALTQDYDFPVESSFMDRVLLIHDLELSYDFNRHLEEVWRVLRPDGRLLVVVPSRTGLWSHAEWSPFGHGRPFTMGQICGALRQNQFEVEQKEGGLFMLPSKRDFIVRNALRMESLRRKVMPIGAGVHIIEARKEIYAKAGDTGGSKVGISGRGFPVAEPA